MKYYFDAGLVSLLKFDLWEWDVTGNLQVDIMTGIVLGTLYILVYDLLF